MKKQAEQHGVLCSLLCPRALWYWPKSLLDSRYTIDVELWHPARKRFSASRQGAFASAAAAAASEGGGRERSARRVLSCMPRKWEGEGFFMVRYAGLAKKFAL